MFKEAKHWTRNAVVSRGEVFQLGDMLLHRVLNGGATGELWGLIPKSRQKLSKKNGIKFVKHTNRLKNYVKIPHSYRTFKAGAFQIFADPSFLSCLTP